MKRKITKARTRARIGQEIGKVPKAGNRFTAQGKSSRTDAMPSGTERARYQKLAAAKSVAKAPAVAPMLIVLRAIAMLLVTDRHAGVRLTNAQRFHIGGTS